MISAEEGEGGGSSLAQAAEQNKENALDGQSNGKTNNRRGRNQLNRSSRSNDCRKQTHHQSDSDNQQKRDNKTFGAKDHVKALLPKNRTANKKDDKLLQIQDDPRGNSTQRITKKAFSRGSGRNTESFDPASTLVRPDLRIHVGSNSLAHFNRPLKHDDVVIVPELFGSEDDWSFYYKLVDEMRELQQNNPKAEWVSWHEGAHLISKHPENSPTFQLVIDRFCGYFHIHKKSVGTRFNWYKDSSDWKPFHHDSAYV
jgi:hypothetical protein